MRGMQGPAVGGRLRASLQCSLQCRRRSGMRRMRTFASCPASAPTTEAAARWARRVRSRTSPASPATRGSATGSPSATQRAARRPACMCAALQGPAHYVSALLSSAPAPRPPCSEASEGKPLTCTTRGLRQERNQHQCQCRASSVSTMFSHRTCIADDRWCSFRSWRGQGRWGAGGRTACAGARARSGKAPSAAS